MQTFILQHQPIQSFICIGAIKAHICNTSHVLKYTNAHNIVQKLLQIKPQTLGKHLWATDSYT